MQVGKLTNFFRNTTPDPSVIIQNVTNELYNFKKIGQVKESNLLNESLVVVKKIQLLLHPVNILHFKEKYLPYLYFFI